jgi:hypothetical protein
MVHGSLASHRRDGNGSRLRNVAPPGHRTAGQPQIAPAEAAQARLFEGLLRNEIAEMLKLPPHAAAEMRVRIAEADRLIKALRHRFPQGTPELHATTDRAPRTLIN